MTNDRWWSNRILRRPAAEGTTEAAEETVDRIMGEKFGIAAGRRLHLVVAHRVRTSHARPPQGQLD